MLMISCSLNPTSRSRIALQAAAEIARLQSIQCELVDLRDLELPFCDANECYGAQGLQELSDQIRAARGILVATPVYNYNVSATLKNLIELTGKAWTERVVGFLCAAGGQGSYMSVMSLANSLMLDFRTFILPRFVYLTGNDFENEQLANQESKVRLEQLVTRLHAVAHRLDDLDA